MNDLRRLTEDYVAAFDARNIGKVGSLLAEDFALEDPAGRFEGRDCVLKYVGGIFENVRDLRFEARNIFIDGDCSIIEFELRIDGKRLVGMDVIEWECGRMRELRAFLYERAQS